MTPNYETTRKKIRGDLHDIDLGNDFLNMTSKAQETKVKMDKWVYIKLKYFYTTKETAEWRQSPQNGKKYLYTYTSVKGLIFKIYNELKQLNGNKTTQLKTGKNVIRQNENLIKKYKLFIKNKTEIQELKNMAELKHLIKSFNNRLDYSEKTITKLKDRSLKFA